MVRDVNTPFREAVLEPFLLHDHTLPFSHVHCWTHPRGIPTKWMPNQVVLPLLLLINYHNHNHHHHHHHYHYGHCRNLLLSRSTNVDVQLQSQC